MGKVAFGACTRGGAGRENEGPTAQRAAREGRAFPWLSRASRSGRKQKQWETGLTYRERSPRYGATLESGDVPDCKPGGRGARGFFGARRTLTHLVAGGLTTQRARVVKRDLFSPLPRDVGSKISARVDLVPAHLCAPETGPDA